MKSLKSKIRLTMTLFAVLVSFSAFAQRTITGTVYMDGKPQAGVTVEAQRVKETQMTDFDGHYSIPVEDKSSWIRFTFIDVTKREDIPTDGDVLNVAIDGGEIPEPTAQQEAGVDLRSSEELQRAGVTDFAQTYTLYDLNYKNNDYNAALPYWRKLYEKYPASIVNIYIQGAVMYKSILDEKISNKDDINSINMDIDTLMSIYDQRIEYFDRKGYVLGRKAVDYLDYKIAKLNSNGYPLSDEERVSVIKQGYNELEESVNLEGEATEAAVLVLYMNTTRQLFALGEIPSDKVAENYNKISEILNANLAKGENEEQFTYAKDEVDRLFQTSGAADCETLVRLYEPQFDEISKDVDELKKMLRVLGNQQCTESELYANASEALYNLEPSAEAAFNMARLFVKRGENDKAKEYYQNAISSETDKDLLSTYYYQLALFTYSVEGNLQQAYNYLRNSIQNNPNNGDAYMLQGDILADYAPNYGDTDVDHKVLYWLAVDKYQKAKSVDADVFQKANTKISTYSAYFPGQEDLFFLQLREGDSYRIEGWINETTTVRPRK